VVPQQESATLLTRPVKINPGVPWKRYVTKFYFRSMLILCNIDRLRYSYPLSLTKLEENAVVLFIYWFICLCAWQLLKLWTDWDEIFTVSSWWAKLHMTQLLASNSQGKESQEILVIQFNPGWHCSRGTKYSTTILGEGFRGSNPPLPVRGRTSSTQRDGWMVRV